LHLDVTDEALLIYFVEMGVDVVDCAVLKPATCEEIPDGEGALLCRTEDDATRATSAAISHMIGDYPFSVKKTDRNDTNWSKLFVGGLEASIDSPDLRDFFSKYGYVKDACVMFNKSMQRSRGFGFVTFSCFSEARTALRDQPLRIKGKEIEAKYSKPKENMGPGSVRSDWSTTVVPGAINGGAAAPGAYNSYSQSGTYDPYTGYQPAAAAKVALPPSSPYYNVTTAGVSTSAGPTAPPRPPNYDGYQAAQPSQQRFSPEPRRYPGAGSYSQPRSLPYGDSGGVWSQDADTSSASELASAKSEIRILRVQNDSLKRENAELLRENARLTLEVKDMKAADWK
jgi:hypothetical protein